MTLPEFQAFVRENESWFRGVHPETPETIAEAEKQLGCKLPDTLIWLLTEWGYTTACGIGSLDESVGFTLRVREIHNLPNRYVFLEDMQDAGFVFLDTSSSSCGEYPIYWTGSHNFYRLVDNEPLDSDTDYFPDYPAWVERSLEFAKDTETL